MNSKIILFLILNSILTILSTTVLPQGIEVIGTWPLDKEKRDLFKNLNVKTEIETIKKLNLNDSLKNSTFIYKNYYSTNGNQIRYELYRDTTMLVPWYERDYITDEQGNILEVYHNGKLFGKQKFDDEGRMIELYNYNENNEVRWSYEYEYDEEGNKTLELQYLYGELVDTNHYNLYKYISLGDRKLIKSKTSLLGKSNIYYESKVLYEYDSLGRVISYQEFGADGKLYIESYRDYNLLIGNRRFYGSDGLLDSIDSLKLNASGEKIENNRFDINGNLVETRVNEYDSDGTLISEMLSSAKNKILFEWIYDDSGLEIEFKRFENEVVNYNRSSTYLDNGLPSKIITDDIQNNKIEIKQYIYEYY